MSALKPHEKISAVRFNGEIRGLKLIWDGKTVELSRGGTILDLSERKNFKLQLGRDQVFFKDASELTRYFTGKPPRTSATFMTNYQILEGELEPYADGKGGTAYRIIKSAQDPVVIMEWNEVQRSSLAGLLTNSNGKILSY